LVEHWARLGRPERHDFTPGLELGEEKDVVDELPRRLDLLARLLDERVPVRTRKLRILQQREDPG
jgi:hypothetical protein